MQIHQPMDMVRHDHPSQRTGVTLFLSKTKLANDQSSQFQIMEKRFSVPDNTGEQVKSAGFGKPATTQAIRHWGSSLKVEISR